ncbi:MAG: DUF885 domain-containing protein, partial [Candidatus Riflebacteria bacterium]
MRREAIYNHPGFARIADRYYSELLSRNPVTATWLGEHSFDGILPETGAEAVERNISFLREMRDSFSTLPETGLSIDERLDRDIAIHFAESQIFADEDMQRWKMGRDLAMNIGDSLFLLFSRDFAALHDRVEAMILRLKAVPMFLAGGKTLFQKVPALWGEIYLESLYKLPGFIDSIEKSIGSKISPILLSQFTLAAQSAKKAIVEFRNWLTHAVMPKASHDWAMGETAFNAWISTRKTGLKTQEIIDLAERSAQQARIQLENLSRTILGQTTGSATGARNEALKRIRRHAPPNFDLALAAYREAVERCRSFILRNDFATLPENEELEIVETPEFMAHLIPFSAYISPERSSRVQKGTYLLTRDRSSSDSSRYNYAEITNSVLHEGYPGHHLQLTGQNLHPGKMRIFADSNEMIEGWAHYCEDQLQNMGFYQSNEEIFAQALDQLFNAVRLKIDFNLQTKKWSFEQATGHLMQEIGLDRDSAGSEVRRYTQNPGAQIGYSVGRDLLLDLKQSLKNQFKGDFTDKCFHDLIIYEGSIPIHMARKYYPEFINTQNKT